jgi:hypothetical protein
MEFCCKTLKEVIEYLFNELRENAQKMIKVYVILFAVNYWLNS